MHGKATGSLLTIIGLAGIAALGVLLGGNNHGRRRSSLAHGADPADRDDIAHLIDKFAGTLPENEAEIMLRRNRSRLKDW